MGKYFLGVDIGSLTTKVVLLNEAGEIAARATGRSGYGGKAVADRLTAVMLEEKGLTREEISVTVATGYGRVTYPI